jgi:hypothetical protein
MVKDLELFLVQQQTTAGSAQTALGTGEYHQVISPDSRIDINTAMAEIDTVGAGFGQDAAVVGSTYSDVALSYYMRGFGAAVVPDWLKTLEAAGFAVTGTTKFTAIPSSTAFKDLTIWHYSGNKGSSGAFLTKMYNALLDWKISGDMDGGKPARIDFTGRGCLVEVPAAGTEPTCTKNTTRIPGLVGMTLNILGTTYKPTKFEFSGNQAVEHRIDASSTYGYGITEITKRKVKFSITVYCDITLAHPLTGLLAASETALSLQWGTSPSDLSIATAAAQVTAQKVAEQGNIGVYEISGQCNANDFTLVVNVGA